MQNAEETLLPATEREIRHRRGDADIDAYIPCGRFVAKSPRGRAAGGEKRGLIAIRAAAEKFHGFVGGIRVNPWRKKFPMLLVSPVVAFRTRIISC